MRNLQVFLGIALLLGVSAEEKAAEKTVEKAEDKKPVEPAAAEDGSKKQEKRGLFDHDFGGHDFSHSSSYSSIDHFGHHHHPEPVHHYEHHDPHHHHHEEKTLTIVKKVPYPVPHVKEVSLKKFMKKS